MLVNYTKAILFLSFIALNSRAVTMTNACTEFPLLVHEMNTVQALVTVGFIMVNLPAR